MYKIIGAVVFVLAAACINQTKNEITDFQVTITDERKPKGPMPEFIDLNEEGKLVILTNRFNEGKLIAQKHLFVELNNQQLDTVRGFLRQMEAIDSKQVNVDNNDTVQYKMRISYLTNNQRVTKILVGSGFGQPTHELINYLFSLPEKLKRYDLKQSYYFSTDEICYEN